MASAPPNAVSISALQKRPVTIIHPPENADWTSNKKPALLRRHFLNPFDPTPVATSQTSNADVSLHQLLDDDGEAFSASSFDEDFGNQIPNDNNLGIAIEDSKELPIDNNLGSASVSMLGLFAPNATMPPAPPGTNQPWSTMYTTDQKWTVSLLKILDDMNAPDYAFESILKWARSANAGNYSFYPDGGLSRLRNIDGLFSSMKNAKQLLPSVYTVACPHGSDCDVIAFDFVPQLLSLLQNRDLMTQSNLVIDMENPLARYESIDNVLGEALTGQVYRDAYDRLITDPSKQLFVPIIQWIDRTSVTGNDRFSLKPYMFTPAIFTESTRRTIQAWGYHGFLPKHKVSSAQNQVQRQGDNIRNYHAQLQAVLSTFTAAEPRLRSVQLPIGPTGSMTVDVITCILLVIQDMQEGDMLCGRFGPHTPGIRRQCRSCDVSYPNLDDPYIQCQLLEADPMAQIALGDDVDARTQWSQHRVDNAFSHVPFADPVRGIFGATPVETMHAFRKGMIEMVTFLVLDHVPVSKKAALDRLAIRFHKTHRQSYRKTYPATDFSNGITNLTKISASERVGLVFLFVILAQYDEGWQILDTTLQKRTSTKLDEVLEIFEAMLCLDAWFNKPTFWKLEDTEIACNSVTTSIQVLMDMCRNRIPTSKSDRWNVPKFHELLHIVQDMVRFGAPMNFCAQRPESLLIPAAKQPGRRAQKRHAGSTYELQAAQRLSYSLLIDVIYQRINPPVLPKAMPNMASNNTGAEYTVLQGTGQATFAMVRATPQGDYFVQWSTRTNVQKMQVPALLLQFLCKQFGPTVTFCTEYCRDAYTFRCHPCFQSDGPIYDWMQVLFDDDTYPCRLAAVVISALCTTDCQEPYQLVVQSATKRTGVKSALLTEWLWDPQYYVVSPESIVSPCFIITIKEDNSKILEALPIEDWPAQFTTEF